MPTDPTQGGSLYEQYLREQRQRHSKFTSEQLVGRANRAVTNAEEEEQVRSPDEELAAQMGGIASFGRNIPGVEATQAAVRGAIQAPTFGDLAPSKFGRHYREALTDIHDAEAAAPRAVRVGNSLVGSTIGALATPGSAVRSGALYGGAEGLLKSDPDAGLGNRAASGAVGAGIGAAAGKLLPAAFEFGRNALGVARAKLPGRAALDRLADIRAKSGTSYGVAEIEGTATPTSPPLAQVLQHPKLKKVVDAIRGTEEFANASDADVARETIRHMSALERRAEKSIASADDYLAGTELGKREWQALKQKIVSAAEQPTSFLAGGGQQVPASMPSLRPAMEQRAAMEGERRASLKAAAVARRGLNPRVVSEKQLETKSPEADLEWLQSLRGRPGEAQAAQDMLLSRTKETMGLDFDPKGSFFSQMVSGFGLGPSAARVARMGPYIRAVGGTPNTDLLRGSLVGTATQAASPMVDYFSRFHQ